MRYSAFLCVLIVNLYCTGISTTPVGGKGKKITETKHFTVKSNDFSSLKNSASKTNIKCGPNEFQCVESKRCIPNLWRCDFVNDCPDRSDEDCTGFDRQCTTSQSKCDGYRCIPKENVCNGVFDCLDHQDEFSCDRSETLPGNVEPTMIAGCPPESSFRCKSGKCLPMKYMCDGEVDCEGGEDEEKVNCASTVAPLTTTTLRSCASNQFTCNNGECIEQHQLCDGSIDCSDQSDEHENCPPDECASYEHKCDNGICILSQFLCDLDDDCGDNSDEINCSSTTTTSTQASTTQKVCPAGGFLCDNGVCSLKLFLCDGDNDCGDFSDEKNCADGSITSTSTETTSPHFTTTERAERSTTPTTTEATSPHFTTTETAESTSCGTDQYKCNNGPCIALSKRCDGLLDCLERDDETDCNGTDSMTSSTTVDSLNVEETTIALKTCGKNQFTCDDGNCIVSSWNCDGEKDCTGGEDERNCPESTCNDNQYQCQESSICIRKNWVCDGDFDCINDDDEQNCENSTSTQINSSTSTPTVAVSSTTTISSTTSTTSTATDAPSLCADDEFMCVSDQRCISDIFKCNREADCLDFSDEIDCGIRICASNEVRCDMTGFCIFKSWVCDGQNDCVDNSDEASCTYDECREGQFACPDGLCLNNESRCDSLIDCYDGSDELNCTDFSEPIPVTVAPFCPLNQFQCVVDGICIPVRKRCDLVKDCSDLSDEENCAKEPCQLTEFRCLKSGNCLPKLYACDGYEDCPDGSDEMNCPVSPFMVRIPAPPMNIGSTRSCDSEFCKDCIRQSFIPSEEGSIRDVVESTKDLQDCPPDFVLINQRCMWVHVFPRKYLRAYQMCDKRRGELVHLGNTIELEGIDNYLSQQSLKGWSYWIGTPSENFTDIQQKEVEIPTWYSNGRNCAVTSMYPAYTDECYFIHYKDSSVNKAFNCNDNAGFICQLLNF